MLTEEMIDSKAGGGNGLDKLGVCCYTWKLSAQRMGAWKNGNGKMTQFEKAKSETIWTIKYNAHNVL